MSETVIDVKGLSKRYRLGLKEKKADTFAGQLASLVKAPLANLRQLTSMTRFNQDDESVFWALKEVDFSVKQGEVLGIIGKNGAGKSTLLKILSRITEPTSGEVVIKGRVSSLLEVGTGFHPELTGRENIYMNGTILGMTKKEIDSKLDEIIDFSGVEKFVDTPVKFYSSGMKVRLGFSVAAHMEPEILIIDEVLAVGDYEFQKKCLGKMESVAHQGRTVLYVSHSMASIRNLCAKCIVLNQGSLVFNGSVNDAINTYIANNTKTTLFNSYKKPIIQNNPIEILEAEILGPDLMLRDQFDADEDIHVRLKCIKRENIPYIQGYVTIKGETDEVYIESDTFDYSPNIFDKLEIGEHSLLLTIKNRVLPKGTFKVYLNFTSMYAKGHKLDNPGDILKFDIFDSTTKRGPNRRAYTNSIIEWKKI